MYILVMRFIIILIYCSEVKLQHTETQQILFRFQEKHGTEFTVEKNQPLDIVLDNFFANHTWCLNFYGTSPDKILIVNNTYSDGTNDSIISVPNVTDHMITRWWCQVLQHHKDGKPYNYLGRNYTAQNIVFNLRSKAEVISTISILYIVCGIGLAIALLLITVIFIKNCCCKPSTPLQFKIDPNSIFYLNLEIFRQQYVRELEAQEPVYEEIN